MKKLLIVLGLLSQILIADDGGGTGGGGGPSMSTWQRAVDAIHFGNVEEFMTNDGRIINSKEVEYVQYDNDWGMQIVENVEWVELHDNSVYFRDEISSLKYKKFLDMNKIFPQVTLDQ